MRAPGETPQSSDVFHSVLASRVLPGPCSRHCCTAILYKIRLISFLRSEQTEFHELSSPRFLG